MHIMRVRPAGRSRLANCYLSTIFVKCCSTDWEELTRLVVFVIHDNYDECDTS